MGLGWGKEENGRTERREIRQSQASAALVRQSANLGLLQGGDEFVRAFEIFLQHSRARVTRGLHAL